MIVTYICFSLPQLYSHLVKHRKSLSYGLPLHYTVLRPPAQPHDSPRSSASPASLPQAPRCSLTRYPRSARLSAYNLHLPPPPPFQSSNAQRQASDTTVQAKAKTGGASDQNAFTARLHTRQATREEAVRRRGGNGDVAVHASDTASQAEPSSLFAQRGTARHPPPARIGPLTRCAAREQEQGQQATTPASAASPDNNQADFLTSSTRAKRYAERAKCMAEAEARNGGAENATVVPAQDEPSAPRDRENDGVGNTSPAGETARSLRRNRRAEIVAQQEVNNHAAGEVQPVSPVDLQAPVTASASAAPVAGDQDNAPQPSQNAVEENKRRWYTKDEEAEYDCVVWVKIFDQYVQFDGCEQNPTLCRDCFPQ